MVEEAVDAVSGVRARRQIYRRCYLASGFDTQQRTVISLLASSAGVMTEAH